MCSRVSCYSQLSSFYNHTGLNLVTLIVVCCRKVQLDSTKCFTLDGTALSRTYAVRRL